eukprot:scaffold226243_cov43-Prasinocladus_malaysianus.AAC.1
MTGWAWALVLVPSVGSTLELDAGKPARTELGDEYTDSTAPALPVQYVRSSFRAKERQPAETKRPPVAGDSGVSTNRVAARRQEPVGEASASRAEARRWTRLP